MLALIVVFWMGFIAPAAQPTNDDRFDVIVVIPAKTERCDFEIAWKYSICDQSICLADAIAVFSFTYSITEQFTRESINWEDSFIHPGQTL